MASRMDVDCNFIKVRGGRKIVVEHDPDECFNFVWAVQFPNSGKTSIFMVNPNFDNVNLDKFVGTCNGELPIYDEIPYGLSLIGQWGYTFMDSILALIFFRRSKGRLLRV